MLDISRLGGVERARSVPFPTYAGSALAYTPWFQSFEDLYGVTMRNLSSNLELPFEMRLDTLTRVVRGGDTIRTHNVQGETRFDFLGDPPPYAVVQARSLTPGRSVSLRARYRIPGATLEEVVRVDESSEWGRSFTPRFQPGDVAPLEIYVSGQAEYEFYVQPIDRRPESASSVIVRGEVTESIDHGGDFDAFDLLPAGNQQSLILAPRAAEGDIPIVLKVLRNGVDVTNDPPSDLLTQSFSSPDRYEIEVAPANWTDVGDYGLNARLTDHGPEVAPRMIEIGRVYADERIDGFWDRDEFSFSADSGQAYMLFLRVPDGLERPIAIEPEGILANPWWFQGGTFRPGPDLLAAGTWGPVQAPRSGSFTFGVRSKTVAPPSEEPYEFLIFPIDSAPETVSPIIEPGAFIRGESLYPPGDFDDFELDLVPGTMFTVLARQLDGESTMHAEVNGQRRGSVFGAGWNVANASVRQWVPDDGRVRIRFTPVHRERGTPATERRDYEFAVFVTDPEPEVADASIAVGSVISGESIDHPADLDTYRFIMPEAGSVRLEAITAEPLLFTMGGTSLALRTGEIDSWTLHLSAGEFELTVELTPKFDPLILRLPG